ncbi:MULTISPECIES: cell division protein FtsB [unclassified Gilliamella]|uniref:cell division protein FtsB n=1 Tax=unclassified Gilliamella TaxID=2685620 RepID=UPI00080E1597|nr:MULTISPECIES: cell division protein FtsB [Gilliamella]MCX8641258.1 cell division protein FtsB [Gilliamella sp. B3835]MCX8706983.1 cell division protein FtsB [Gilliamella sp. B3783]MCX8709814.1 cell division protein FtsB [Gilliamella sp. B3780]MCX8711375.1 cell division protein FtsB [Gilliamella sp. B3468]MCX8714159.1 cell division protein FtsB [Gilliamella sp. B3781]
MIRWKVPLILLAVLSYLQYSLWYGKNNVYDYQDNVQILADLHEQNAQLKDRNEQMFAEINDLQRGSEAIEERARSHLGMVKPNEYFYRIIVDSKTQHR